MTEQMSMEEKVDQMMIDLASVKTDVTWLKKIFMGMFIPILVMTGYVIEYGMVA